MKKALGITLISLLFAQTAFAAVDNSTAATFIDTLRPTINGASSALDGALIGSTFTGVPITNHVETIKESVVKKIVINIARAAVQQMVNSTIMWANTGFEGKPVYLDRPESYFRTLGDQVVGDVLNSQAMGLLCAPFQGAIKLAIAKQYVAPYNPQCTLTKIGANLADFYTDFNKGGWDAWFVMTQEDSNNPYGAYIGATLEINSQLASKLDFANKELQANDFFFSTKDCLKRNPNSPNDSGYDANYKPGACVQYGPTKTPGSVIATQINEQLHVGQDQLINATEIDQLINAVMIGLLQRTVFSQTGLFNDHPDQENPITIANPSPATASCKANAASLKLGGTGVWTADVSKLPSGTTYKWVGTVNDEIPSIGTENTPTLSIIYTKSGLKNASLQLTLPGGFKTEILCTTTILVSDTSCSPSATSAIIGKTVKWTADPGTLPLSQYAWSGTDIPSGTNTKTFDITYQTAGTKTAKVTLSGATGNPITMDCGSVEVREFDPLEVSCSAADQTAKPGQDVFWDAYIKGGSGSLASIQFAGEEENAPGVPDQSGKIWPDPSKLTGLMSDINAALANLVNVPNKLIEREWSYLTSDSSIHKSYISFSISSQVIQTTVRRAYFTPASTPYTATLKVVDSNPKVAPVTATCAGGITITP